MRVSATFCRRGAHAEIRIDCARGRANAPVYQGCVKLVDAIFDEVSAALVRGDRVELRGFGAFFVRTRSARPGHNPKNLAMVSVPERLHPAFKTGKEMHRRLNGTAGSELRAAFHKATDTAEPIGPKT
jgi:integration host factor subunit beta